MVLCYSVENRKDETVAFSYFVFKVKYKVKKTGKQQGDGKCTKAFPFTAKYNFPWTKQRLTSKTIVCVLVWKCHFWHNHSLNTFSTGLVPFKPAPMSRTKCISLLLLTSRLHMRLDTDLSLLCTFLPFWGCKEKQKHSLIVDVICIYYRLSRFVSSHYVSYCLLWLHSNLLH